MLKRSLFTFLFFGVYILAYPCNCEVKLDGISKSETDQYTVIFTGYVKRIHQVDGDDIAEFVVDQPYKGLVPRDIKISYDARTSCQMHFLPGDQWLIYAKKDTINKKWLVHYCERSRRFPEPGETDEYTTYTGITLEEELSFLGKNYSSGQIVGTDTLTMIEEQDLQVVEMDRRLKHANPIQMIILLACSFAGMIVIYYIIRRFLK